MQCLNRIAKTLYFAYFMSVCNSLCDWDIVKFPQANVSLQRILHYEMDISVQKYSRNMIFSVMKLEEVLAESQEFVWRFRCIGNRPGLDKWIEVGQNKTKKNEFLSIESAHFCRLVLIQIFSAFDRCCNKVCVAAFQIAKFIGKHSRKNLHYPK